MITTNSLGCKSVAPNSTIEETVLTVAAQIKAVNPKAIVGQYWRSPFALEIAQCSAFSAEWAAHPEWRLKNDSGSPVVHSPGVYYIDFVNPSAAAFFAKVLVNVSRALLSNGVGPILDYIYIDGPPDQSMLHRYLPGIGPERSTQIVRAMYATYGNIQQQLDSLGHEQKVILNGMDTVWQAQAHQATGAAGSMFDHWTIIQFLNRTTGVFNVGDMETAFDIMSSALVSNVTIKVKGWPGPIIAQRDIYPPSMPSPKTPADFQRIIAERFNSELALFLLVATERHYFVYSWFWMWYDYVPNNEESTIPPEFFPQAQCGLGSPKGAMVKHNSTFYTREFEKAHVTVDLLRRSNCRVDFIGCQV